MNPAAGCTVQRQSDTLIAALRTRVADQSSDACQYFRIIAEGCSLLVSFVLFLLPFIPSVLFLLLHIWLLPSSFMSSPLLLRAAKPNECRRESQTTTCRIEFFKATRRRFNATGIMRLDRSYGFRSRSSNKGRANRGLRTSLGSSRRSLVSCRDLSVYN